VGWLRDHDGRECLARVRVGIVGEHARGADRRWVTAETVYESSAATGGLSLVVTGAVVNPRVVEPEPGVGRAVDLSVIRQVMPVM